MDQRTQHSAEHRVVGRSSGSNLWTVIVVTLCSGIIGGGVGTAAVAKFYGLDATGRSAISVSQSGPKRDLANPEVKREVERTAASDMNLVAAPEAPTGPAVLNPTFLPLVMPAQIAPAVVSDEVAVAMQKAYSSVDLGPVGMLLTPEIFEQTQFMSAGATGSNAELGRASDKLLEQVGSIPNFLVSHPVLTALLSDTKHIAVALAADDGADAQKSTQLQAQLLGNISQVRSLAQAISGRSNESDGAIEASKQLAAFAAVIQQHLPTPVAPVMNRQ